MARKNKQRGKKLSATRRSKNTKRHYKPPLYAEQLELALRYQRAGQLQMAESILRGILAKDSKHYEATFALGLLYHQHANHHAAISWLTKTVELRPGIYEANLNLGIVQRAAGQLADAQASLENAVALAPNCAKGRVTLGLLLIDRNQVSAALRQFKQAIKLQPDNAEAHAQLGLALKTYGDNSGAIASYRLAIALRPDYGEAHRGLSQLYRYREYNDDVRAMEVAYRQPQLPEHERMLLSFALGKVYDDLAEYDKAFDCLLEGNRLKRKTFTFSISAQQALFEQHQTAFTAEFIGRFNNCSQQSQTPIFILGMPRSGTSLVEHILASHPQVHGAGEVDYMRVFTDKVQQLTGKSFPQGIDSVAETTLIDTAQCYVDKLSAQAPEGTLRVTDKLPHNFLRIGLIAAVMPNAKIIHCRRDPIDNCLSIFQHHFSAAHGYASDLTELGQYYRLYQHLMDYWQQLLPGRIYSIDYELLVEDTEPQIHQLLNFCELDFCVDCLDFYQTKRIVNTPSASQVRKPIYRHAVARWKPYARQLDPLLTALQDGQRSVTQ